MISDIDIKDWEPVGEPTKLYNVPTRQVIQVLDKNAIPPGASEINLNDFLWFRSLDGMYSYCLNKQNEVCHLFAGATVQVWKKK